MIPQRVTLITLGTADLSRAKAFYGRLGWQPVQEQEGVAFYQLNGMGLGLAISRRLADHHGGQLWAEAGLQRGACFVLDLPVGAAPETIG